MSDKGGDDGNSAEEGTGVTADKLFSFSHQKKQLAALLIMLCLPQKNENTFCIEMLLLAATVSGFKGRGGRGGK